MKPGPKARPAIERFEALYCPEPNTGCWLWTAYTDRDGYGYFGISRTRIVKAHRWSYEHFVGPIPAGLVIDHICRQPSCVNWQHLEPVTQRINVLRGSSHMAKQARRTHCIHGHAFTSENTRMWRGHRKCRLCDRLRSRVVRIGGDDA